jgi:hypothetical protein
VALASDCAVFATAGGDGVARVWRRGGGGGGSSESAGGSTASSLVAEMRGHAGAITSAGRLLGDDTHSRLSLATSLRV